MREPLQAVNLVMSVDFTQIYGGHNEISLAFHPLRYTPFRHQPDVLGHTWLTKLCYYLKWFQEFCQPGSQPRLANQFLKGPAGGGQNAKT